ncbi:copper amine oxidase N-terminal domain-containing protein [Ureibacillus aquaedulcis]|uniref:Copper amine oxidase N-terminal domain-containing protein n=1 Tax=Ureibacillus aquaedulcis TaxID=3058421 RepID=A0ABT8GPZ8_9BACL|nr:copper amine oxidase N-terminal domain-containing protein [Ureibacillus sp. BA0131]MDN4493001.1 copper amine oxidase N-terminal domain-containing protein [Ureibacillus sp. BA0131]
MKKIKKLAFCALATGVLVLLFKFENNKAHASQIYESQIYDNVVYDGKAKNGRTYAPVRGVGEELNAQVKWNNKTKVATVIKGHDVITLKLGSKILKVNDKEIQMDVSLLSENGKIYLPMRSIGEAFGGEITWSKAEKAAHLSLEDGYVVIYTEAPHYAEGIKALEEAINKVDNLSNVSQKRIYLKSHFTDSVINKIIHNNGFNFEVHPFTEYEDASSSYIFTNNKTLKVYKHFGSFESKFGLGDITQIFILVEENGKWLVSDIKEDFLPFRP